MNTTCDTPPSTDISTASAARPFDRPAAPQLQHRDQALPMTTTCRTSTSTATAAHAALPPRAYRKHAGRGQSRAASRPASPARGPAWRPHWAADYNLRHINLAVPPHTADREPLRPASRARCQNGTHVGSMATTCCTPNSTHIITPSVVGRCDRPARHGSDDDERAKEATRGSGTQTVTHRGFQQHLRNSRPSPRRKECRETHRPSNLIVGPVRQVLLHRISAFRNTEFLKGRNGPLTDDLVRVSEFGNKNRSDRLSTHLTE